MYTLSVLHIASFHGNIGDNANHNGFRKMLRKYYPGNITFDEIEMREFYQSWNIRNFNSEEFIVTCNDYDLVVIGGGNFFELKWDYSVTGTTVNMSNETLEKIQTPIFFNALGCDIAKGASREAIEKFKRFLDYSLQSPRILISLRNDGSYKTVQTLYGADYAKRIPVVPDGAFFMEVEEREYNEVVTNEKLIGLNIVSDMSDLRFDSTKEKKISYDEYLHQMGKVINAFLMSNNQYTLLLFPHIYSDLKAIYDLMIHIDDRLLRTRIKVAPLLTGSGSEEYIFGLYKKCQVVMGMRFHSNVCAIAHNIPTIGLSSYKKIDDLYEELKLGNRIVHVNQEGFQNKLSNELIRVLKESDLIKNIYIEVNKDILQRGQVFYQEMMNWLMKRI
ncbi:Polysaccharide pyruvyl transferase family protein WcaK [Evansella caseinilytica]|uniref:Polysaccharide pyruvyl transferase family protein WcaK n=1 Tax=Evansella caseinilytica TaxID=1503961 RepID=A0A1H3T930_9BACI|nr:polysaccharide pyruvyl transferase family protein [Evansella caseinilytica]SDZ46782.1 Polysaccharide pyruvyl transferase family protein WcaK [Evansella caseinilytica]